MVDYQFMCVWLLCCSKGKWRRIWGGEDRTWKRATPHPWICRSKLNLDLCDLRKKNIYFWVILCFCFNLFLQWWIPWNKFQLLCMVISSFLRGTLLDLRSYWFFLWREWSLIFDLSFYRRDDNRLGQFFNFISVGDMFIVINWWISSNNYRDPLEILSWTC